MSATLEEDFITAPGSPLEGAPAWFNLLREEGLRAYESCEWPTRKDENWRFGRPKNAQITEIPLATEEGAVMDLEPAPDGIIRLTFLNGYCVSLEGEIPEGLVALPLNKAIYDAADLVSNSIPEIQGKLGSKKLAAFHRANLEDGTIVYARSGTKIEQPIEIVNLFTGSGRSQSYLLVVAEKDTELSIAESFISTNDSDVTSVLSVLDIITQENADVSYLCSQQLNNHSTLIRLGESLVSTAATARTAVLHLGGSWVRDEFYSTVAGRDAKSYIMSVAAPYGKQEIDQRTFQHHASPYCYSDLVYKNTLYDQSKTVFSGLIFVDEGAHYTDAYQTCRNLLMSDVCEANSMPGLEINADQVSCSHGSTSSQVSPEEIFYLQTRGIESSQARQLIAEGFCADAFKSIKNEYLMQISEKNLTNHFIERHIFTSKNYL